jgi:hypothetical protein
VTIVASKTPQVSIPVDSDGAASKRAIYRQLIDDTGRILNREKVDIVLDNTTTTWLDIARS